jgi:uncharacterized protein YejL (UPF0352 family)
MGAFDTSGITSTAMGWLQTGLFWLIFVGIILFGLILYVKIKKRRKLRYPLIEVIDLGGGKMGMYVKNKGCGWFNIHSILFGLIENGEEVMKSWDGRRIFCASSVDFQEINGKRGLVVKRKDDDPKILVPLTKMEISNLHLISEIAPSDFRDASTQLIDEAKNEMKNVLMQYLVPIAIAVFVVGMIITMVILQQTFNHATDKAAEIIAAASQNAISMKNTGTTLPSNAPLLLPLLFRRKKK